MQTLLGCQVPLMRSLLAFAARREIAEQLHIEPLADGGMGSFRIGEASAGRRLGQTIAEVGFSDIDGVYVTAVLNVDAHDRLLEVDIWKVDFSPLLRWPSEHEIRPLLSNPSLQRTASPPAEL